MSSIGAALDAAWKQYSQQVSGATLRALLAGVSGRETAWLLSHREEELPSAQAESFMLLAARAAQGEPLAYLLGERDFWKLRFKVGPQVLVPRPETELLVEVALKAAPTRARIVDVGTGSGIAGVTLAYRLPDAYVLATDYSAAALRLARENAVRHGVAHRMGFVQADLLAGIAGPFDVIAANLPYIDRDDLEYLGVKDWEPRLALDGGIGGLALVEGLIKQTPGKLRPGGLIALEIGAEQGPRTAALLEAGLPGSRVEIHRDLAGLDRVVSARIQTR